MFIGLDLGTSGVKTLLMDEAGRAVGSAEARMSLFCFSPVTRLGQVGELSMSF